MMMRTMRMGSHFSHVAYPFLALVNKGGVLDFDLSCNKLVT
jgi:hypothetical protein